jgi:hypothetical protein
MHKQHIRAYWNFINFLFINYNKVEVYTLINLKEDVQYERNRKIPNERYIEKRRERILIAFKTVG